MRDTFEYKGCGYSLEDVSINNLGDIQLTGHAMSTTDAVTYTTYTSYASSTGSYKKPKNNFEIKKIQINPSKNATTVIFVDGSAVVVKKSPEDPEADIFSVVAYAVAKKVYGSNSAFKREIYDKLEFIDKDFKKALKKSTDEELLEIFKAFMKGVNNGLRSICTDKRSESDNDR